MLNSAFILKSLLLLFGSCLAIAEQETEIVDFTDVIFEQTVYADPSAKKTCPGTQDITIKKNNILCEPDPFTLICKANDLNEKSRLKKINERINKISEAYSLEKTKKNKENKIYEMLEQYGANPIGFQEELEFSPMSEELNKYPKEKNPKESVERRLKSVADFARKVFVQKLSKSRLLSKKQVETVDKIFKNCTSKIEMRPSENESDADYNASLVSTKNIDHKNYGIFSEAKINLGECKIYLNPKEILECQEWSPHCFQALFHEMGHLLNSCSLYSALNDIQDESGIDTLLSAADHADEEEDEETKWFSKKNLFSKTVLESEDCLKQISDPKEAIPNTCPLFKDVPMEIRKRCSAGNVKGYPSQWDEALADFWSATAFSHLLTYAKSERAKNLMVLGVIRQWCENKYAPPEIKRERNACDQKPADGYALEKEKYHDHQSWEVRMNRNLLRNSDLRQALGCTLSKEIPMACSPLGDIHSVLIYKDKD